jgi:hypothetical protein
MDCFTSFAMTERNCSWEAKCGNPWLLTASIATALRYLAMTADSLSGNF